MERVERHQVASVLQVEVVSAVLQRGVGHDGRILFVLVLCGLDVFGVLDRAGFVPVQEQNADQDQQDDDDGGADGDARSEAVRFLGVVDDHWNGIMRNFRVKIR